MERFTKCVILIIIIIVVLDSSFAQNTGGIKGIIKDSASGETIPYANLQILKTKLGINSNIKGSYLIQNIPIGMQEIQITAVGYKNKRITLEIKNDELLLVNVLLSPEPIELQGVTNTAERIKQVYETNISVQSITQEELKLVPLTVEKDIFRVLRVLPGISTTGDVTSQFFVRGGGGDQNLILVDNMMVYNPFHAFGLFSIFNADAIKVSEVLTGGFGPEFGGRLSSVINIVTKEGNKNNFGGKINFGLLSGQGIVEGPIYNGSFFLAYRKSYFDEILKKFLGKDLPLSFYDLSGKISFDISDEGKLSINGLVSKDNIDNSSLTEPNYYWTNNAFGVNLQSFLEHYFVNVSFSYSSFDGSVDPKNESKKSKQESKVSNFFFNSKVDYFLRNNDLLSFGLSFLFPRTEFSLINTANYFTRRTDDLIEADLWLKYKWTQLEKFILELGARTSYYSYNSFQNKVNFFFEPRISMKYQIHPDFALKASAGRYYQVMVTTSNEDDVVPLFETWIPVLGASAPERADHYIFGLDGYINNSTSFTLQGYYKIFDNIIGYNLNKTSKNDPDFSFGMGYSYGAETLLKYNSDKFHSWLSYTLSWAEKTISGQTFPPHYDKRHSLNLILGAKIQNDFDVSLHWELSSGMPFTPTIAYFDRLEFTDLTQRSLNEYGDKYALLGSKNSLRLPWYQRLDLSISKTFVFSSSTKLNLNFDLINLYDYKNIFYFDRDTGERINMLPFMPSLSIGVEL